MTWNATHITPLKPDSTVEKYYEVMQRVYEAKVSQQERAIIELLASDKLELE